MITKSRHNDIKEVLDSTSLFDACEHGTFKELKYGFCAFIIYGMF